jgi:hypothetical protein
VEERARVELSVAADTMSRGGRERRRGWRSTGRGENEEGSCAPTGHRRRKEREGRLTRVHLGCRVGPTRQWVADLDLAPRWMR